MATECKYTVSDFGLGCTSGATAQVRLCSRSKAVDEYGREAVGLWEKRARRNGFMMELKQWGTPIAPHDRHEADHVPWGSTINLRVNYSIPVPFGPLNPWLVESEVKRDDGWEVRIPIIDEGRSDVVASGHVLA